MKFTIDRGTDEHPLAESYDSLEEARAALRAAMDWSDIRLGPGYTTADGASQVWFAYPTQVECDQDPQTPGLPRIKRIGVPG